MPASKAAPLPNSCTNCGGPVRVRRPSQTGHHYCSEPVCQAAKQRFFRSTQVGKANETAEAERLQLVADLATGRRSPCHQCGLEDGLPGWAHRDATGLKPCFALGNRGKLAGAPYLDAIHPGRVPAQYRPDAQERGITIPPVGNA
jgi:hypothetical protein